MATRAMIKSKYPPMRPTQAIGSPLPQPNVDIPEPATLVGDLSGKPYVNVGDSPAGREGFQVTPPDGQPTNATVGPENQQGEGFWDMVQRLHSGGSRAQVPGKPVSMALGGAGQVGPDLRPEDFANAPAGSSQADAYSQYAQAQQAPPQPQAPQQPQPAPQQQAQAPATAPYDPVRDAYNRQNTVYQNQNAGVDARAQQTNAQGQVYSATAGTFGPMQNQINANGQVLDAQGRVTGASRALIQSSQADNTARTSEEQQLQADARNTPDLQAAAQAQTYRNDMAYKNSAAGVSAAQEYVAPPGDTSKAPAGTLAKIQTKGQVDTTAFANADKLRALQLEASKNGVDLLSNDVQGLQEVAAKVGLTVDQARLLVSEASNNANFAGLAVQNADNNTSRAVIQLNQSKNIDPSKVAYQDPTTGNSSLMSPAEARLAKANDDRRFAQTDPGGGSVLYNDPYTGVRTYMTQAEADQNKIDYQRQVDTNNLGANAGLGGQRNAASTAVQSAQEVQYAQTPNALTTPVSWLLQNMTGDRIGPSGTLYHNQGLLSQDQVIAALIAHGFTPQQARDMTAPNTAVKGGSGGNSGKPSE